MQGEGVVHALRHVHKLLAPKGILVDIHPVTEEQVETQDGAVVGVIEDPAFSVDLPNAEACLERAIRDGFYTLEAETEFDFLQHFDEVRELIEAKREHLHDQPALLRRIQAATPPVLIREHCVLRRLRAEGS